LVLDHFESRDPPGERELGDDFAFTSALLQLRMELSNVESSDATLARAEELLHTPFSINLNISLASTSTQLGQSRQTILVSFTAVSTGQCQIPTCGAVTCVIR
jgi:nuclear pore complex protein Nup188